MDFTVYGLIPLGVTIAHPSNEAWIALVVLEVTFFVNAAGLFFLSALIEKNQNAKVSEELTLSTDQIRGHEGSDHCKDATCIDRRN